MTAAAALLRRRTSTHARWAAAATGLACGAALVASAPPLEQQVVLVAASVAVLGFPHGALDPLVAALDGRRHGGAWVARFVGAYVGLALAVVALWLVAPSAGLVLFLVTSAVHFGLGDVPKTPAAEGWPRALRVAVHGAGPIVLPAIFHPREVSVVFGWLLGTSGSGLAEWIAGVRWFLLAAWIALAVLAYARPIAAGHSRDRALELALLTLNFALLPPLLSFAVYFCVWHSARHLITVDAVLGADQRARGLIVALAVLAVTAVALLGVQALAADPASFQTIARTIFIALAALTPPHMFVTARLSRRLVSAA